MSDAAAALKLEVAEVERLVAAGEALAVRHLVAVLGGAQVPTTAEFEGAYLAPVVDGDGTRWITEQELQRCEAGRAAGPDPNAVAAAGQAADLLTLTEAARIAGLSTRYLRSLCAKWERNRERIEAARAEGKEPPRPFLIACRGTKRQWLVKRSDLVDYLRHRTAPAVRVGYDLTLTTEKSLGVLALLGDDQTRRAVLTAIEAGNDRGLAHLEHTAAMARVKGGPVSTRGWTVASFRHLTSRALDPFPHHHNVVANTVVDPAGTRRALDARWLYRHASEASALATAEMRYRLTTDLGVRWRRGRKSGWEIDGIPDEVVRTFSRRSNEVDEAVAELEALIGRTATIAELRGMVTKTRPAKRRVNAEDLVADWRKRAGTLGFGPRDLARCTGGFDAARTPPEADDIFERLAEPDGLCSGASVFTRAEVISAVIDMAVPDEAGQPRPMLLTADSFERLADEFLASDYVVELLPTRHRSIAKYRNQALFTTAEMLSVQTRVLDRFRAGSGRGAGVVSAATLAEALSAHGHLTAEQRDLVAAFVTSGDRGQCAIGRAGAGKTTAMRAAAAAWSAAGYKVLGTAVKGEAARHLGSEAGIPSETLAWHLAHKDPTTSPLDARTILIVDEASTVCDRDLDRLLWLCEATGAAVRLIGDPDQHGAVGAGGMFRVLCEDTVGTELQTSHRVANQHDRAAADALREGRIADAMAELQEAGHLHVVTDEVDLYLDLLQRWWEARRAGDEHPMVDRRNHTRLQLNRLAHRLLQVTGEIGSEEIVAARDRRFSVGDRVVARTGDRTLYPPGQPGDYIRNGATGTVVVLSKHRNGGRDSLRVDFNGLGEIDLPRSFFDEHPGVRGRNDVGLDLAYAVTSYAVQGLSFVESTSRIDENASRAETYVDITRGRVANHLYLTRSVDPLDGERLPRAPRLPIEVSVGERLSASGPEHAAVDVDPIAPAAASARVGRDLADLHVAVNGPGTPANGVRAAERLRGRQAARLAARYLDPTVLAKLPPRIHVPFLARQWDETVSEVGLFLTRWNRKPGGTGPWDWALGAQHDDPAMRSERREVAETITALTIAMATERARAIGNGFPAWAPAHLAQNASHGRCVHDPRELSVLYDQIDAYRRHAGVTTATTGHPARAAEVIFGAIPDDLVLRAQRRALVSQALDQGASLARSAPTPVGR